MQILTVEKAEQFKDYMSWHCVNKQHLFITKKTGIVIQTTSIWAGQY